MPSQLIKSEFVAFLLSRQGVHQGSPLQQRFGSLFPSLLSLFPSIMFVTLAALVGASTHLCVFYLYSRHGQFSTYWCSSVLCHFGVKSKFKPESRTHTTELGKHFLNTLGCRVTLKHWPVFAHRIPIQCRRDIRLQHTHKSADESGVCCFPLQQTRCASREPSVEKIQLSPSQFAFTFPSIIFLLKILSHFRPFLEQQKNKS